MQDINIEIFPKIMHMKVPGVEPNYEVRGFFFGHGIYIMLEVYFVGSRTAVGEVKLLITLQLQWRLV